MSGHPESISLPSYVNTALHGSIILQVVTLLLYIMYSNRNFYSKTMQSSKNEIKQEIFEYHYLNEKLFLLYLSIPNIVLKINTKKLQLFLFKQLTVFQIISERILYKRCSWKSKPLQTWNLVSLEKTIQ